MKFVKQFGIILFIAFISEIFHKIIPLPIPTSIYGIVILFICLSTKIIKVSAVKEISSFLIETMPIMFIPSAVGLIKSWGELQSNLVAYGLIIIITTILVMVFSGRATQFVLKFRKNEVKINE